MGKKIKTEMGKKIKEGEQQERKNKGETILLLFFYWINLGWTAGHIQGKVVNKLLWWRRDENDVHICTHTHTYTHAHAHTQAYMHAHAHACMHTHTHIHTHTHTTPHTHKQPHTHTHTPTHPHRHMPVFYDCHSVNWQWDLPFSMLHTKVFCTYPQVISGIGTNKGHFHHRTLVEEERKKMAHQQKNKTSEGNKSGWTSNGILTACQQH